MAYSEYAFATTTGVFRMFNNVIYLSDVLAAPGIAMLVSELNYHFEPIKCDPFKLKDNITLIPRLGRDDFGKKSYEFYLMFQKLK